MKLTKADHSTLESLHAGPTVQTIDVAQAQKLADAGLVRIASVQPMPDNGLPVNITARGRGVLVKSAPVDDSAETA